MNEDRKKKVRDKVGKMTREFSEIISSTGNFRYKDNKLKEEFLVDYITKMTGKYNFDRYDLLGKVSSKLSFQIESGLAEKFLSEGLKIDETDEETLEIFSKIYLLRFSFDENHRIYYCSLLDFYPSRFIELIVGKSSNEEINRVGLGILFGDSTSRKRVSSIINEMCIRFLSNEIKEVERQVEDFFNRQIWMSEMQREFTKEGKVF